MSKKILVAVIDDISTDERVNKVCHYLLERGYDVTTYSRELPNSLPVKREYKIIQKKHWFQNNFLFYSEYNLKLFFFLLRNKYDVFLSNDLDTLMACYFASKIRKKKLVYDSHELFSEGSELQGRKFVQGFWRRLENYFLPRIKNSYTVSQSISDFYDKKYHNKMGVVRNVPLLRRNITKTEVSFPTKNKVVLYQGVLNPGRGVKPVIKSLHYLKNIDFVIIGYGKIEQEIKQFVVDEKLEERVHFLGRMTYDKLFNYTKIADVGVVLQQPLGKSFEYSLPNKLFDYIHAELPLISGNLLEISKIVKKYNVGIVLEKATPRNIAKSINELIYNEELREKIKRNQKKTKKKLCWEKEKRKLDVYF